MAYFCFGTVITWTNMGLSTESFGPLWNLNIKHNNIISNIPTGIYVTNIGHFITATFCVFRNYCLNFCWRTKLFHSDVAHTGVVLYLLRALKQIEN